MKLINKKNEEKITEYGEKITLLEEEKKIKDIELKRLKIDLKVKINENKNNKRIKVKFQSSDGVINEIIESFEDDTFNVVEEKLYVKFGQYRDSNNMFLANGNQILRYKSLKDNKIKDGHVIIMNVITDD